MNVEMAYLTGMILGNGEIQRGTRETTITIDIPYKNLYTDDLKDVSVYVKASTVDIRSIIEPLIGHDLTVTQSKHSTKMSFTKSNDEYVMRELKLRACQHREKILERQMSELNRRERVHRLCTRAGMLESFLVCPGELTDDQVMELLKISFRQPEVVLV